MAVKRRRSLETDNLTSLGVSADGEILDDWDKIVKICNAGRAEEFYSIGNWKNLDWGTYGSKEVMISGFNRRVLSNKDGVANTSWMCCGYIIGGTVAVAWSKDPMRTSLNGEIKDNILEIVKDNLKEVLNYSDYLWVMKDGAAVQEGSWVEETADYLWVPDVGDYYNSSDKGGCKEVFDSSRFYGKFPYSVNGSGTYVNLRGATKVYAPYSSEKSIYRQLLKKNGGYNVKFDFNDDDNRLNGNCIVPCFCI